MEHIETLKPQLNRIQMIALVSGLVALVLCGLGAMANQAQFFQSYLLGYLFWIGLSLGSLALVSLHHLVAGGWGFVIQRLLESGVRTLPLMAILTIPLFFGMQEIFMWARPEVVATDKLLQHKEIYLNVPFFWVRIVFYFIVWSVFAYMINRWAVRKEEDWTPGFMRRLQTGSGMALVFYVLTLTFFSFDLGMSLDPHWFSTIFGLVFVIGQALLTLAFAIVAVSMLKEQKPLSDVIETKHFHDLGNLMLAFVLLWVYISFSQFLIIWSGNLPEEIPWYLHRLHGGWQAIALIIVLFHFALPFIVLLLRRVKKNITVLAKIAGAMIVMRFVDLYWVIAPNFHHEGFTFHWMDLLAPVGIGGLWLAYYVWQLQGRSLLPQNDPRLAEAFQHE